MKNFITLASAFFISEVLCGFLPPQPRTLDIQNADEYSAQQLAEYAAQMEELDRWLTEMEATGAVNLNVFNQFHRKNKAFPGAMLGVDMEVDEIGIFFIEENLSTPFHWEV